MWKRRRFFAYTALFLLAIWSIGTFFLSRLKIPKTEEMRSIDERAIELKSRLGKVEAELAEHEEENREILRVLSERLPLGSAPSKNSIAIKNLDNPIALLVLACNRPEAIKKHLEKLILLRPSKEMFPIVVSQDCSHEETAQAIRAFGDQVSLIQQPDHREFTLPPKQKKFIGYYKIARHYRWALNQTFFKFQYQTAIITEDDLDIAVDFFEYFTATYPLLRLDPSLWCVSAWNDNGKAATIKQDPQLLHRTDFFPGLGWMLRRSIWEELEPQWPEAYWDDWMRKTEQRKTRACIRPEISRTAMSLHGKKGVSKGLYFEKHLKHIVLNRDFVSFTHMDLSYLLRENYDPKFVREVYSAPSITQTELRAGKLDSGQPLPPAVRLTYDNKNTYKTTAKAFGLMEDFRAGVPRTAYRGVVPFMFEKTRVFLAPFPNWEAYDPTWT